MRMAERGHVAAVATPWQAGAAADEGQGKVELHRIRQQGRATTGLARKPKQQHQPPFPDPVSIWQLRRLINRFRPDIIHSYGWISFSVAVAMGCRRIPLLVTARDYGYFCATRTLVRKGMPCSGPAPVKCLACAGDYYGTPKGWAAAAGVALSRPLLERKMTGLHSISSYVHKVTSEHLRRRDLVEAVIPSFQDYGSEADTDATDVANWLERLPVGPFIPYVGAFRRVKGLEILFAAYRRLDSPPPLVLLGTYERDSPLEFPAEATILTDAPHAVVMSAWEKAMFGVMPSLWPEPLGVTVAEAMSCGKPVIGTRLGGHADMLDETS